MALSVSYANPREGFDASYLLVDLVSDKVLAQFDEMASTAQEATKLLSDRWQGAFNQQMAKEQIISGAGQQLSESFSYQNRRFSLKMTQNALILNHGNTQKQVAAISSGDATLIASYLSPHEGRIAIILLTKNQIQVLGSHLLVGFK